MSLFPKKTIIGGTVFMHTSMYYKGRSRPILVTSKIIDPSNNIIKQFTNEYFHFPKIKSNYIEEKTDYTKGYSGLIYAKFLEKKLNQQNSLSKILERLTLASHDYLHINIKENFLLGKYQIISEFIVDGMNFKSATEHSDFF